MIPAAFEYFSPTSVDEAVALLREHSDAKVLAGGQSLTPVLRLRLAAPETIVDLGKIDELRGIRDDGDALVLGAMTPHSTVQSDPLVGEHARLISPGGQQRRRLQPRLSGCVYDTGSSSAEQGLLRLHRAGR